MEVIIMTNKEAIEILKNGLQGITNFTEKQELEAFDLAIKALKNESNLKSRIGNIIAEMENDLTDSTGYTYWDDGYNSCCRTYLGMLKDLIK